MVARLYKGDGKIFQGSPWSYISCYHALISFSRGPQVENFLNSPPLFHTLKSKNSAVNGCRGP